MAHIIMQNRIPFLVACLMLLSAPISFARLGETLDQCKTRYGAPAGQTGKEEFLFNRDHIEITVHFRADRSVQEDFAPELGSSFSAAQVSTILQENSEGSEWAIISDNATKVTYLRKDGRAVADNAREGAALTDRNATVVLKYTTSGLIRAAPGAE